MPLCINVKVTDYLNKTISSGQEKHWRAFKEEQKLRGYLSSRGPAQHPLNLDSIPSTTTRREGVKEGKKGGRTGYNKEISGSFATGTTVDF